MPAANFFGVVIITLALSASGNVEAQTLQHPAKIKQPIHWMAGRWQLTGTQVEGRLHEVKKEEFDCIVSFKAHHLYSEEVFYESDHWIIAGQWKVHKGKPSLALTGRHYIQGNSGKLSENISFVIYKLTDSELIIEGTDKGMPVKMYYRKIP